jgi:hypothetical protein
LPAGDADRDVGEIHEEISGFRRTTTANFDAMHQESNELVAQVDRGFAEMRDRMDALLAGQQQLIATVTTLVERRTRRAAD